MSIVTAATITSGLTRGQVRWAQEHNWFVDWHMRDGVLCVLVSSPASNAAGEAWLDTREISDWQELRAWAGY